MVHAEPPGCYPWHPVGPGVFTARVPRLALNVAAVAGRDGFVLVDTGSFQRETRGLLAGLARILEEHGLPFRALAVVNTHGHFDHCYGNAEVLRRFPDACVIGHQALPGYLRAWGEEGRRDAVRYGMPEADMAGVRIVPPTRLVAPGGPEAVAVGRDLSLVVDAMPEGAHTCADLVVYVPHCGLVLAGDLVEQSAPPACGPDSFPFTWPDAIRRALDIACLVGEDAGDGPGGVRSVLPGHGDMVDAEFAAGQRREIEAVVAELRRWHARGRSVEEAVARGDWPWEAEAVRAAVTRGYRLLDLGADAARRA